MKYFGKAYAERQRRAGVLAALTLAANSTGAAEFEVTVLDRYGGPVADVAVYVEPDQSREAAPASAAEMRQLDFRFDPDLLIVQTGTRVEFPNDDVVAHHVYSFSKPNNFVLSMFKGSMRPHVTFEHAGVVAVGCNLHDHMVGYILVVDSGVFGKTGRDGKVYLEADNPQGVTINIWNPRIKLETEKLAQFVKAGRSAQVTFLLTEELHVYRGDGMEALSWREDRIR